MKQWAKRIFALAGAAALCLSLSACQSKTIMKVPTDDKDKLALDDSWTLTLNEEFEGSDFNHDIWRYGYSEEGVRRGGYWVDDAIFVKDGNLTIRTNYRENGKFGAGWYMGSLETAKSNYNETSKGEARKASNTGFSQTHGYFEVKCKVPPILGGWAAFWLMPDNNFKDDKAGTGEDGAEIDIFESPLYAFKKERNCVTHAIHIDGYGENLKTKKGEYHYEVKDLYDEFHTYGLMWNEDEYIFYIDGHETWRTKDAADTVAQVAEYIILSVEIGGYEKDGKVYPGKELNEESGEQQTHWSGDVEKNDKSKNYDFVVDYVKVWQKK